MDCMRCSWNNYITLLVVLKMPEVILVNDQDIQIIQNVSEWDICHDCFTGWACHALGASGVNGAHLELIEGHLVQLMLSGEHGVHRVIQVYQ